ncbi:MAG: thermonuclease family protein [Planctomycetes bacterium]|nr:thermonuclease family protein [Planctomycetota bacterium]
MCRPLGGPSLFVRYAGLLALSVVLPSCGGPPGESARIVEIPRVNQIEIATGETIQLIGVDEIIFPDRVVEMSDEAARFTRRRLSGKVIYVKRRQAVPGRGDRVLGDVYLGNDLFNAEVIRQGYGKTAKNVPAEWKEQFEELEKDARQEKRGLWAKEEQ